MTFLPPQPEGCFGHVAVKEGCGQPRVTLHRVEKVRRAKGGDCIPLKRAKGTCWSLLIHTCPLHSPFHTLPHTLSGIVSSRGAALLSAQQLPHHPHLPRGRALLHHGCTAQATPAGTADDAQGDAGEGKGGEGSAGCREQGHGGRFAQARNAATIDGSLSMQV